LSFAAASGQNQEKYDIQTSQIFSRQGNHLNIRGMIFDYLTRERLKPDPAL